MPVMKCSTLCLLGAVGASCAFAFNASALDVTTGWLAGDYNNDGSWEVSESDAANFANSLNAVWNGTGTLVTGATTNFADVNAYISNPLFAMSRPGDANSSYEELLGAPASQANATWEVIFRPGDFTGDHVIFETGGSVNGTIIRLFDNTLNVRYQDSNSNGQEFSADLTNYGSATEFFHITTSFDTGAGNAGSSLFVNGLNVGAASLSPTTDVADWVGGNGTGLGQNGEGQSAGSLSYANFTGDIALMRHYNGTLLTTTEAKGLFVASTGIRPAATLGWEAVDYDGNGTWELSEVDSSVTGAENIVWLNGSGTKQSGSTNFAKINDWISSPSFLQGQISPSPGNGSFDGATGSAAFSQADTTFEVVFRPGDYDNEKHLIFDHGGNGQGVLLELVGNTLTFTAQNSPGVNKQVSQNLSLIAGADNFFHIIAVVDTENPNVESGLYINGNLIGTLGSSSIISDWAGGDFGSLGADVSGSTANGDTGGFTPFDGDLAIYRIYNGLAFDQNDVDAAYNAVIPEPSSLALLGIGGMMLARRRRRD